MKNRYLLSVVVAGVLMLLGLQACNSGVFVDDFAPSAESISLASDGHAQVIDFKADNWDIFGVYTLTGETIRGDVYDADGQWLGSDPMNVEPGWTKYVLNHPTVALTVERTKGDKLCITSTENAGGKPFECFIDVGNDYDRRYIRVGVEPSEAYQLDSIVYRLNSYSWQDSIPWSGRVEVLNPFPLEKPLTTYVHPYENQSYRVQFTFYEDNPLAIFGENKPEVPVVDADKYGFLYVTGRKIPLDYDVHELPVPDALLAVEEQVTIPAHYSCQVKSIWWYEYFGVDFRLYASHPRTGRKREFSGTLDLHKPQAYDIYFAPLD